jgi:hypothetical protein
MFTLEGVDLGDGSHAVLSGPAIAQGLADARVQVRDVGLWFDVDDTYVGGIKGGEGVTDGLVYKIDGNDPGFDILPGGVGDQINGKIQAFIFGSIGVPIGVIGFDEADQLHPGDGAINDWRVGDYWH